MSRESPTHVRLRCTYTSAATTSTTRVCHTHIKSMRADKSSGKHPRNAPQDVLRCTYTSGSTTSRASGVKTPMNLIFSTSLKIKHPLAGSPQQQITIISRHVLSQQREKLLQKMNTATAAGIHYQPYRQRNLNDTDKEIYATCGGKKAAAMHQRSLSTRTRKKYTLILSLYIHIDIYRHIYV